MKKPNGTGMTSRLLQLVTLMLLTALTTLSTGCSQERIILKGNTVQMIYSGTSATLQGPAFCLGPEAMARLVESAKSKK